LYSCATGDAAPLQVLQPIWDDKAETAFLVAIRLQARAPQRRGSFRLQILMISLPRVVMLPN
jgi:hypothetical protein